METIKDEQVGTLREQLEKASYSFKEEGDDCAMTTKISYRVNERATIQVEANTPMDAIEQIGHYVMILSMTKCGSCQSTNVHPQHDNRKGFDFYCVKCHDCGSEFSFGQHREGDTLFPKTEQGWHKWQASESSSEEAGF